jgi:plasmid stabilization system protein ParE
MTVRFRTEPEASGELAEARLWYERRRAGLGLVFLEAIDAALEFIAGFPEAGSPVTDVPRDLGVRRVPVRRFPFHVVYLELPGVIRILAFAHDRRLPGYWRSRI